MTHFLYLYERLRKNNFSFFSPECEIILVENNPTVNIYRSVAQIPESSARSQEGFSLPSASYLEQFYQRAVERRRMNGMEGESGDEEVPVRGEEDLEVAKRMKLLR